MITLLSGENSFEISRALQALTRAYEGEVRDVDGSELELRSLPDLLMGMSLFESNRLIIIRGLSENKALWTSFVDWIPRISSETHVVLVEAKPDKRTLTYKELKKVATVHEFAAWGDRDIAKAETWAASEAKKLGVNLQPQLARLLVQRVGLDQWSLFHALEKLAVLDEVNAQTIEEHIDATPSENVFALFDTALKGNVTQLQSIISTLSLSEEPYKLFALLSAQVFQLAVAGAADGGHDAAKEFGIHPFVLSKLSTSARQLGPVNIKKVVLIFAKADDDMKLSKAEPWFLIERALLEVALLR